MKQFHQFGGTVPTYNDRKPAWIQVSNGPLKSEGVPESLGVVDCQAASSRTGETIEASS